MSDRDARPRRPNACPEERLELLTAREMEVFRLLGNWKRKDEIASVLGISPRTVEAHRARIREKLGIGSWPELLRFSVQWLERQTPAHNKE